MNHESLPKENLKELLDEFFQIHYNGSFSRMVSEYIRATGMTEEEQEALWKTMKEEISNL